MLKKDRPLHNLLFISGMIGLIVLAFILDILLSGLTESNSQMGGMDLMLVWMYPLMQLLWMLVALGLVWLMISAGGYSRWVSVIYLLLGLFILYANPILFVSELPESLYVIVQYLAPGTMVFQAGGLAAAMGLLSLWFWKKPISEAATDQIDIFEGREGNEDLSELPG